MTPAERLEAAGRWLAEAGGRAARRDVGAALELNQARQADVLRGLVQGGWGEGDRLHVWLTPAGWARFGGVTTEAAGEVLERTLAGWPYAHRAHLELQVCSLVARWHLGGERRDGHLSFIAVGETGTGKSAMGGVVCHLFGFPPARHSVHVPAQTAGSLLGRRVQDGDGWRWEPAKVTRLPYVVLDEFDKAEMAEQRRVWPFLDGQLDQLLEDQVHELLPTVLLTANPPRSGDRYAHLRQEYRRRSVVLDSGYMAGRSGELEELLERFYAHATPADRLDLDRLAPPPALDDEAKTLLRSVRNALTDQGRAEFPGVRSLELATLGRLALLGPNADHATAAYATAVQYLQVSATVPGQVRDGWEPDLAVLRAHLGQAGEPIAAALEAARVEREQAKARATAGRTRKVRADLEVVEAGERLAEQCRQAAAALDGRKVGPAHKAAAAGLRKVLRRCATTAAQVTTPTGLAEVSELAADPLRRAGVLVAQVNADRAAAEQARHDRAEHQRSATENARLERIRSRQAAASRRQQLSDELTRVTDLAKQLEAAWRRTTTRPGEDVLATLNGFRVLTYTPPPPQPRPSGFLERLRQSHPDGTWRAKGADVAFPGSSWSCPALAAWGPNTRRVLAPALGALHRREDELRTELGRKPRSRPVVPTPAPVQHQVGAGARYGLVGQ